MAAERSEKDNLLIPFYPDILYLKNPYLYPLDGIFESDFLVNQVGSFQSVHLIIRDLVLGS